jgi:hypothetical protein
MGRDTVVKCKNGFRGTDESGGSPQPGATLDIGEGGIIP